MKYQSSNTKLIYDLNSKDKRSLCPECTNNRGKKKNKDLQYYSDTNTYYCFHCEATLFEYKPFQKEREYIVPEWKNKTELSDKAVKFFESRCISQTTLNKMKVCTKLEYMPQFNKEVEVICFPMYADNEVKNVKYRGAKKSFKLHQGSELIWYNADALKENKEVIIVEGEIDCLSWIENGFDNVVSVPNGANKNLEYLDNSIELFKEIDRVYIATDQDTKGIELRDELIRRLGAEKCSIVSFKQYKDSNEYLCKEGGLEFKDLIKNSKPVPVKGAVKVESIYSDILDLYENGVSEGLKIDNQECDKFITWELGRLAIVTGVPSSGKSEFVDYLVSRLNFNHKWKAAYFSPENYPLKYHYAKLHEKFSGAKFKKETDKTDFLSIYEYIKSNFFYILDEQDMSIDKVLEIALQYIKQHGIKILVIDPYNVLDHQISKGMNETQYVSLFLDKLLKFTRFNNILTFLIAHPRKMQKGEIPTLYDISGSAHFYNKTDYGFTVNRERDENNLMTNEIAVYWQKIKFKNLGQQGISELKYNYNNGRFETGTVDMWDNSNWLVKNHTNDIKQNDEFDIQQTDCPF